MAIFAILRHILSLYSNQKTTCASSISAVRENRSPWNHQRFLADTNKSEYIGGGYFEKTSLEFTTTDEIQQMLELAFVVTDVHDKSYLIGVMEAPFPIVNITTKVDDETNISEVKVTFQRQKPLIPCSV